MKTKHVLPALLAFLALPAVAQQTPEGYYANGWPIALAEAACDGDEYCLTRLANCAPGATECLATAALCTAPGTTQAETAPRSPCFAEAFRVDDKAGVMVHRPGEPPVRIDFGEGREVRYDGTIATMDPEMEGGRTTCIYVSREPILCVQRLSSNEDLAPWAPK